MIESYLDESGRKFWRVKVFVKDEDRRQRSKKKSGITSERKARDWEFKLKQMEAGKLTREEFMREIATMTEKIVKQAKEYESDTVPGDFGELKTPCPKCGGLVKETYKTFQCSKSTSK